MIKRQMQLPGKDQQAATIDASNGQQRTSHALLAAPNSAQVQQPQDVPQPSSTAALLHGSASTARELQGEPEDPTLWCRKRSGQGLLPHSSKRQRQEAPASVSEQPAQRNNQHSAPTAPDAPQRVQPASIHAGQQPQPQQASRLSLAEMPTEPPQAAEQLAPQPAVQQPSLYDLLMDVMQQPAAAAAGLTAEMAAGFLDLLPVQAGKVTCKFFVVVSGSWIAKLLPSHCIAEVLCRSAAWWSCCDVDGTAWQRP
jgi:hypothetical protein